MINTKIKINNKKKKLTKQNNKINNKLNIK